MNLKQALTLAKKHTWNVCSGPITYMLGYPFMIGFMRMEKYYPEHYDHVILSFMNELGTQWTDEPQNIKNIKQLYENPKRTRRLIKTWLVAVETFYQSFGAYEKKVQHVPINEVFDHYLAFLEKYTDLWAPPLALDSIGLYTEGELLREFLSHFPAHVEAQKDFITLCHPSKPSFMIEEHLSILQLARAYKQRQKKRQLLLKKHQQSFFWIENNYLQIKVLSLEHFRKKVEEKSQRTLEEINHEIAYLTDTQGKEYEKERILRRLNLPKSLQEKILFTAELGTWQDQRKKMCLRANHMLTLFLETISRKTTYSLKELYHISPEELQQIILKGKKISRTRLKERHEALVMIVSRPANEDLFSGSAAKEIIQALHKTTFGKISTEDTIISGVIVSYGKERLIEGKVRIVLDPASDQFLEGEILVASMTRPEYVPLMKKAKAIITDEGGITSHAGIVSRELSIPCIVGTKIATKILKNGMRVEIDINKGMIIPKLEKV